MQFQKVRRLWQVKETTLRSAVQAAAAELGVEPNRVGYKLDLNHFRSKTGTSVSRQTVRIEAWEKDEEDVKAAPPKKERKPRKPKKEAPSSEEAVAEAAPEEDAEGDLTKTEAAAFAETWFSGLLEHMDVKGSVSAVGNDERIRLRVEADRAGRIIGRRGTTIGAIRHLLSKSLASFGDFVIDVDIPDDRRERRVRVATATIGTIAGDRRDRGDRGDRRGPRPGSWWPGPWRTSPGARPVLGREAPRALRAARPKRPPARVDRSRSTSSSTATTAV